MHEIVTLIAKYAIALPLLVGVIVWFRMPRNRRLEMAILMVVSVVVTAALMKLASMLHQDPRPFVRDGVHPYFAHSVDNGFPSDHTAYSAVIAFVVLRYSRLAGAALAIVSLLIGASRVVAGVHHGQDIIGGFLVAAIGVVISILLVKLAPRPRRKQPESEA